MTSFPLVLPRAKFLCSGCGSDSFGFSRKSGPERSFLRCVVYLFGREAFAIRQQQCWRGTIMNQLNQRPNQKPGQQQQGGQQGGQQQGNPQQGGQQQQGGQKPGQQGGQNQQGQR